MNMCRFGNNSDSATRSTSCQRFFGIHFCCGESPILFPFKPLILTPPAKISNNCLPLQFIWQGFLRTRPWHNHQTKQQKMAFGTRCRSSFVLRNGRSTMSEQIPWWKRSKKTTRHVSNLSLDQYKKACQARFSTSDYIWTTWAKRISHPAVVSRQLVTYILHGCLNVL